MAWVESHQSLSRHRKLVRLIALLKEDKHKLIGHLNELWWWGIDNVPSDGDLGDLLDEEIAFGAEWTGDAAEFVSALTTAGFIDVSDDGSRCLHDWHDYAGKLLDKRAADRERKRKKKDDGANGAPEEVAAHARNIPEELQRKSNGAPEEVAGTVPNPTLPNQPDQTDSAHAREAAAASDEPKSVRPSVSDDGFVAILSAWEGATATTPTDGYLDPLLKWLERGIEPGVVVQAIEAAAEQKSAKEPPERIHVAYVESIVQNWHNQGIHSDADAKQKRASDKARGSPDRARYTPGGRLIADTSPSTRGADA